MATPVGGAISVLRVSGFGLREVLAKLGVKVPFEPRVMARTPLHLPASGRAIDDALFCYFENPRSYTGEEVVEFYLHGSAAIAGELMDTLREMGLHPALPGEFSFRAVRNGKLTVAQAQAVAELITAKNTEAITIALDKLSGRPQAFVREIAEELRNLAAFGELSIDFSDQDVDEVSLPRLQGRVRELLKRLTRLEASFRRGRGIQEGLRVALLGLPNAGKSSFFNQVLGEDRSIVSEVAGTTRDEVRESLTLRGDEGRSITLRFADTAGVRETADAVERVGVERSLRAARDAELVIVVLDPTDAPDTWLTFIERLDEEILLRTQVRAGTAIILVTKRDREESAFASAARERLDREFPGAFFSVSNQTGEGVRDAVDAVVRRGLKLLERDEGETILTRADHAEATGDAIAHLDRALETVTEDLFAADVRQALSSLGPVIGDTLPDDILGKIFSEFCIGK